MNLIKVQFLRNGKPQGRAYTYDSPVDVKVGDAVQINADSKGIVTEVGVDPETISFPMESLKSIKGVVPWESEEEAGSGSPDKEEA